MSPRTSAGGCTRLYAFFMLGPLASGYAAHDASPHTPKFWRPSTRSTGHGTTISAASAPATRTPTHAHVAAA